MGSSRRPRALYSGGTRKLALPPSRVHLGHPLEPLPSPLQGAAARICASVDIPIVADLDTGFGGPLNVFRTVEQAAADGVAGFILEDQEWPKKCGHMEGRGSPKRVISCAEHTAKIAAAAEARGDSEMVIIARTDA
eukprot:1707431-Prymnesium_polylepis.1